MMARSVLFLSYLFPPRGGAGVQRALKFAKYLPAYGWRPLVVASGGDADDGVTREQDATLLRDLGEHVVVHYTQLTAREEARKLRMARAWRRRLEATDAMGWWVEPAVRTALELHERHSASAILVTMSPFSSAAAGVELKRRTGLPLALDLRDPWALDETKIYPTRWHAGRDLRAMRRALAQADLVIMNTPESAQWTQRELGLPASARFISIPNGFDADDYTHAAEVPAASADVLRIVHTGLFHTDLAGVWDALHKRQGVVNWLKCARRPINLWTRTPRYLLEAIDRLVAGGVVPANKIELVLVGELTDEDKALVERSAARPSVKMLGYRSHDESVGWLKSADLLFLPVHTPLDGGPSLIVPGKTYEYIGSGRPVLAMCPPGDVRRIIGETRAGFAVGGDDVAAAAEVLERAWRAKRSGQTLVQPDREAVEEYSREKLAARLARELEQTVGQLPAVGGAQVLEGSPRAAPAGQLLSRHEPAASAGR